MVAAPVAALLGDEPFQRQALEQSASGNADAPEALAASCGADRGPSANSSSARTVFIAAYARDRFGGRPRRMPLVRSPDRAVSRGLILRPWAIPNNYLHVAATNRWPAVVDRLRVLAVSSAGRRQSGPAGVLRDSQARAAWHGPRRARVQPFLRSPMQAVGAGRTAYALGLGIAWTAGLTPPAGARSARAQPVTEQLVDAA